MMPSQADALVASYLDKLRAECSEKQWGIIGDRKSDTAQELQAEPPEVQIAFLKMALKRVPDFHPHAKKQSTLSTVLSSLLGVKAAGPPRDSLLFYALSQTCSGLMRHKLPYRGDDLAEMISSYADHLYLVRYYFPPLQLIAAAESTTRSSEIESAMRKLRKAHVDATRFSTSRENRKILERIDDYLSPGKKKPPLAGATWAGMILGELEQQPEADRGRWLDVFNHCLKASSATPSKAWRQQAAELTAALGSDKVRQCALRWLDPKTTPLAPDAATRLDEHDADYLKGFVWLLADLSDAESCRLVADSGLACLRKIPNLGPVSARVGFACINVLSVMSGLEPVAQLTRMRGKTKYAVGLKLIEKALNAAAERSGLGREDLEDMAVPDLGLNVEGRRSEQIGDARVEIAVTANDVEVIWTNAAGKPVKAPPAEVKRDHAAELKAIKRVAADLEHMVEAQRLRLERSFMDERKIAFDHWSKYFLNHPLMGTITRRLIWRFENSGRSTLAGWNNGRLVNWDNEPVTDLGAETKVQLWHPLQSDTQTIFSWRCWLEDHRIVQPFKQAHREVYILTPAEEQTETYSNRFAAHVIRQHQFASLCRQRGWQYRLMGSGFDGHNVPVLEVPGRQISAHFWVELAETDVGADPRQATDQISGSGINLYLLTDQVRFFRGNEQAGLAEIPPLVFSEIMRDVDLFVGVASIGNDPTWTDHGETQYGRYWQTAAFGDLNQSGETRRTILEKLLPQLAIASQCKLDGKFLVVRGDLHTYRIHLGSANVLMEPGSHYLCIVPDRGPGNWQRGPLYLPFDGDHTLAIILSKAIMLAADKEITDQQILRQIGR